MATRTVNWVLPTTYVDGSAITDPSKLITHVFADGVEVGASLPGASSWTGDVPSVPGQVIRFTAACEMDGVPDDLGPSTPEVVFAVPFPMAGRPTIASIT